ncbi:tryptophan synthase subunit alpha [Dissulfurispira thermophila]|uniref:tryptophan synthase n=1 Tax=hot springs metagenome TaxID=433727 RepID=A0A5J4L7P9_9ZZZZ|nr:tryptophan synthase subunit alpha [Dissulfurispira thermophila]
MNKIETTFKRLKAENKKAFIPYIMAGDPDLEKTIEHVMLLTECGADIIELGVPFSDPLADGPTIQRAAERALKAGVTLRRIIQFVKNIRQYTQIPIVLMTYYNPVFKYGELPFIKDSVAAGIDGVIIPDLPPEEGIDFIKLAQDADLSTIFLVAPTSTRERIKYITSVSSGFIYYVSMTGITGSKLDMDRTFKSHIAHVKKVADKPVAVGFGVSTPEDAKTIAQIADGVIIGSAIVKRLYEHPLSAKDFIKKLREAI